MASTVTITIPNPTLIGGDTFIVKYKLISDVLWTSIANQTNSPFTISGLADGDYELSINIASVPDEPSRIICFTVESACNCLTISNITFEQTSGVNLLSFKIDASISGSPAIGGWPPCGIRIQLTDPLGNVQSFDITSPVFLSSGSPAVSGIYYFSKALTGTSYLVNVYKNCCTGNNGIENISLCTTFSILINNPDNPITCVNAIFRQTAITASYDSISGNYYLYAYAQFPTPCDTVTANFLEGFFVSGSPDSGSVTISSINALIPDSFGYKTLKIQVNPNPTDTKLQYHLNIHDCCGTIHYLS